MSSSIPSQIYALQIDATADQGNQFQAGEQKSLLVLARAGSAEEAASIALVALAEYRWRDGRLAAVAPLQVTVEAIEDQILRDAAAHASQHGYALICY